jgi:hypothetical protein
MHIRRRINLSGDDKRGMQWEGICYGHSLLVITSTQHRDEWLKGLDIGGVGLFV